MTVPAAEHRSLSSITQEEISRDPSDYRVTDHLRETVRKRSIDTEAIRTCIEEGEIIPADGDEGRWFFVARHRLAEYRLLCQPTGGGKDVAITVYRPGRDHKGGQRAR